MGDREAEAKNLASCENACATNIVLTLTVVFTACRHRTKMLMNTGQILTRAWAKLFIIEIVFLNEAFNLDKALLLLENKNST